MSFAAEPVGAPARSAPQVVDIFHNILWSRYKGAIFSALHRQAVVPPCLDIRFFQIAATEHDRIDLAGLDTSYHQYPYELLYDGAYEQTSSVRKSLALVRRVVSSGARLVVLPGYHLPEHWAMLVAAKLTGKKICVFCDSTAREGRKSRWRQRAKRFFFERCDGFFSYGSRSSDYLRANGARPETIFEGCQAAALPHSYRQDFVIDERAGQANAHVAKRLLYVGRLSAEKGLMNLVEAFAGISARFPDCTLRIVGSGPQQAALSAEVVRRGLTSVVVFAGSMDAEGLGREYLAADFLVLPSLREPWGLVVNEALSYGCPVLVSDACGCVPELVHDGRTGFCFVSGSASSLEACVVEAFERPVSRADWSAACLQVIQGYSAEIAGERMYRGLKSILDGAPSR